ncbi:MAG: caspase family protein [Gemmatimonadota bacterium]
MRQVDLVGSGVPDGAGLTLRRAATLILFGISVLVPQIPARFTLGDSRSVVRQVQGEPQVVERLHSLGAEVWDFGSARVTFDPITGKVIGWNDPSRRLRVELRWTRRGRDSVVTIGSALADVARLIGTPWAVTPAASGVSYLAYARSVIGIERDRVRGWIRRDDILRVERSLDSTAAAALGAGRAMARAVPVASRTASVEPAPVPGAPVLQAGEVLVHDASGDGRIALREFADVTIEIRNRGARLGSISGRIVAGPGLHVVAGVADSFSVSDVAAGGTFAVSLAVYATTAARERWLSVLVSTGTGDGAETSLAVPLPGSDEAPPVAGRTPLRHAAALNGDALAVVIGVGNYRRLPQAQWAAEDARLISGLFTQSFGVPASSAHLVQRLDAEATGGEMQRIFGETGWLARRANDNSDILVYFAGHGVADASTGSAYLLPWDGDAGYVAETGIAFLPLLERLARLRARSVTVIVDACFSGVTRSRQPLVRGSRAVSVSIEHPALLRRNMAVFLAARGAQTAGVLPRVRHGLFTWFVASGAGGGADANADGSVTVTELGSWLRAEVSREAGRLDLEQEPLFIARDSLRVVTHLAR